MYGKKKASKDAVYPLKGLVWSRVLLTVGLTLIVVGPLVALYGPRVDIQQIDIRRPATWLDPAGVEQVAPAANAGIAWGRGIEKLPDGTYATGVMDADDVMLRKEGFWAIMREYDLRMAQMEAERAERELADTWMRVGVAIFAIGVIVTLLALGLKDRPAVVPQMPASDDDWEEPRQMAPRPQPVITAGARDDDEPEPEPGPNPEPEPAPEPESEQEPEPAVTPYAAVTKVEEQDGGESEGTEGQAPQAPMTWTVTATKKIGGGGARDTTETVTVSGGDTVKARLAIGPTIELSVTPYTPEQGGGEDGGETPA